MMALLTCVFGGQTDILCSATAPTSPLTGMIPMYLLMSAFHSSSWLKLMSSRRNFTDRIEPPHSNRRSPRMLSGRWVLGRQTRNLVARPRPLAGAGSDGPKVAWIGIGGHLAMPPLPHHRAYGSVPRRFDWVKLGRRRGVGADRVSGNSGCAGLVGPPGVRTCARTPSVNRRRPLH